MGKAGAKLLIWIGIESGATDKHPLASLYDANGDELPESPVPLTHVAKGAYFDDSVTRPDTPVIAVVGEIYDDSSHTILSDDQGNTLECISQDPTTTVAVIPTRLVGEVVNIHRVTGVVEEDGVVGQVDDGQAIVGSVGTIGVEGVVKTSQSVVGTLEEC